MKDIQADWKDAREKIKRGMARRRINVAKLVKLSELSRATVDRFLKGQHVPNDVTVSQLAAAVGLKYEPIEQRVIEPTTDRSEPLPDHIERVAVELMHLARQLRAEGVTNVAENPGVAGGLGGASGDRPARAAMAGERREHRAHALE